MNTKRYSKIDFFLLSKFFDMKNLSFESRSKYNFMSIFLFLLFLNPLLLNSNLVNLEEFTTDYVLENKQIKIPDHPHAFNASIIRLNDRYLLSFREMVPAFHKLFSTFHSAGSSQIGLVWLDDRFEPMGKAQMLELEDLSQDTYQYYCAEDARLIMIDQKIYMIYSDNKLKLPYEGAFRVYQAELILSDDEFIVAPSICYNRFEYANARRREKNWVPFDYQGNLLFAYSLNPHRILRPMTQGECVTLCKTKLNIDWPFGELRGGTPALLIDDQYYLSFFHSSINMESIHSEGCQSLHYFMGAYTFENKMPFKITSISKDPIIGKGFYEGEKYDPYWKPVQAVFPCGFVYDDQYVWVSYGRQDHEIWILKLDKQRLIQSLHFLGNTS